MAKQQTAEINSHRDIEALVEGWDGFSLYENFMGKDGGCSTTGGRPDLRTPWPKTGEIYRFLKGDYSEEVHRYALVTEEGEVILSARFSSSGRSSYGQDMLDFSKKYSQLKRHLDEAGVSYLPDTEFENSIIEAARTIIEAARILRD